MAWIKIGLAIMLLAALLDMSYGYYQLLRFVATICFGYFAFKAGEAGDQRALWIYGALALLFQPFFKVALGRELWNVIDAVVAVGLLLSLGRGSRAAE